MRIKRENDRYVNVNACIHLSPRLAQGPLRQIMTDKDE